MAYVYRHIRLDKNVPFYIGIGTDASFSRSRETTRRNKLWSRIAEKTEHKVQILFDNLTHEEAKQKEIEFIALYGRIDKKLGPLANLTDGGDGTLGAIVSKEKRELFSRVHSGKVNSPEVRKKISDTLKSKPRDEERIAKFLKDALVYSKSIRKKVLCMDNGMIFDSATEAGIYFGVNRSAISKQINGVRKNKHNLKHI
jgi:translation initiation factor 2 beta subunit (eIF-2beta)/eIF-5